MHYLILAVLILILVYAGLRAFLTANPANLARNFRTIGGVGLLVLALFFLATGRFPIAIPLGVFAFSLLARNLAAAGGFNPFQGNANKSTGQRSRVRTRTIDMELDHDTGDMEGHVLKGKYSGKALSGMTREQLLDLWDDCQRKDRQAAQLLEAFLMRRFPDWRDEAGEGVHANETGGARAEKAMSKQEAYEILGLETGASRSDIHRAHRTLMKKMHPDQGGSTYLATKINEAKDLLLG